MRKQAKYHVGIEIDKLTNSIVNRISGDCFSTEIHEIAKDDLKTVSKKNGWLFGWAAEYKLKDRKLFKLTIKDNPNIVQGIVSISDYTDHFHLHLIESAPFNTGKEKLYEGVPGNLFAYVCKCSKERGYDGFVAFTSKTRLIEHYTKTIGAIHVGGHKMIIFPENAHKLINKYFQT